MKPQPPLKLWLGAWGLLLIPTVVSCLAIAAYAWTFRGLSATESPGAWGTFGDFLGGLLNPLVSGLTLFVAISVWRLQREEMELTRNELEQTKRAMEEQAKTAEQQRQEQRFFDLLNVYFRTVENIRYTHRPIASSAAQMVKNNSLFNDESAESFNGKAAISAWLNRETNVLHEYLQNNGSAIRGPTILKPDIAEQWTVNDPNTYFGSYFRVVRYLLVEATNLLGDQDQRYVALFCAQLSEEELVLLTLHLWFDPEGIKVQPMAGKYRLLATLPKGELRTELESELPRALFETPRTESQS